MHLLRNRLCIIFFSILQLLLYNYTIAQISFNGLLINKRDSTLMSFANVKLVETDKYTSTNEKGEFNFVLPQKLNNIHFEISSIGCHTTITYIPKYNKVEKIYVDQLPTDIKEVTVVGLTAKSIVKKAIVSIPVNYSDSSYASFSFYRQYQKVNDNFKNIVEARPIVMFNLSLSDNKIQAKESFAVQQIRRSTFEYDIKDYYGDECTDLFSQNPVYHLTGSSLDNKAFDDYRFSFDTLILPDAYVIDYLCNNYTSDNHGISNYSISDFNGESREYGKLIIDKTSFAIIRYERTAVRNKKYNYPKFNNFIIPDRKYTFEFLEGHLIVEYQPIKGKWYLKKILHDYTNEFYRTQTYSKDYTITDAFEWYADTITRYIPNDLLTKFYFTPHISSMKYTYDRSQWSKNIPEFYFYNNQDVYKSLRINSDIKFR